jgi:hypothetical protein
MLPRALRNIFVLHLPGPQQERIVVVCNFSARLTRDDQFMASCTTVAINRRLQRRKERWQLVSGLGSRPEPVVVVVRRRSDQRDKLEARARGRCG